MRPDGGPAFPIYTPDMIVGDDAGPGMSLRDWFAGQALANASICTGTAPDWQLGVWFGNASGIKREQIVARQAAIYADAMIAARSST